MGLSPGDYGGGAGSGEDCKYKSFVPETYKICFKVNQSLLDIHKVASDLGDAHLCDFLESQYLSEQVDGIKEIGDLVTKIKRAGEGLGLLIIDKEIMSE